MKRARFIKYILISFLIVSGLVMTACEKNEAGNKYEVYYMNSDGNKLVKKSYSSEQTDAVLLADELLNKMNTKQKNQDYIVIKPDNVNIEQVDVTDNTATLTFSDTYYEMKASTEVLLRTAIVQELCQIDGIDWVRFKVGEQDALHADGTIIGPMNQDSFANDSEEGIGNIEWRTINLYYANKTGDKLIKDEVPVAYSKNISLEKIVVEKLIKGPVHSGTYATLPSDMHLLGILVNNRTCYVNISSEFITELVNVSTSIPIYSIVNSLCDLGTVDNVKILINGSSAKTFRESINLDTTFTFNDTLIQ